MFLVKSRSDDGIYKFGSSVLTLFRYQFEKVHIVFMAANGGLGGWGDHRAVAGGTEKADLICLVFKKLSKDPSR